MPNVLELRQLKEYYVDDLYTDLRGQQELDQAYIDDTFPVPEVKSPHTAFRLGIANKIVSSAAEQLITSNPQAFIHTDKKTQEASASKISFQINEKWMTSIRRMGLAHELVKNDVARGESILRLAHNERWVTGEQAKYGNPVLFGSPDPMVIYSSINDDDSGWVPYAGVPNFVIVCYPRQPLDVLKKYPSWSNPKNRKLNEGAKTQKDMVEWWEYWDKDIRYFEADGVSVLKGGIQPNIYGFTPFIRKRSGFGKESPDGDLTDIVVSDLRRARDLIKEATIVNSDIASILHLFAHKPVTIILPEDAEVNEASLRKELDLGSYALNLLYLPTGSEIFWGDKLEIMPSPEMFQYYRDKVSEIYQMYPFLSAGFPSGSSGRQQDLSNMAALRRYEAVLKNTEDQMETAMEMAVQIIRKVPKLLPEGLAKNDLDIDYRCEVVLKADDPVEADRKATMGRALQDAGHIDHETNLIEYQGYTRERAQEIINKRAVDDVIMNDPIIRRLVAIQVAREMGMEDQYLAMEQQLGIMEKGLSTASGAGSQGGPPRTGNIRTPLGQEMADVSLTQGGQRRSPVAY